MEALSDLGTPGTPTTLDCHEGDLGSGMRYKGTLQRGQTSPKVNQKQRPEDALHGSSQRAHALLTRIRRQNEPNVEIPERWLELQLFHEVISTAAVSDRETQEKPEW